MPSFSRISTLGIKLVILVFIEIRRKGEYYTRHFYLIVIFIMGVVRVVRSLASESRTGVYGRFFAWFFFNPPSNERSRYLT